MTGWFERQPHSCFLYVANVCLRGYHDAPELLPTFRETFARMSAVVFRLLSAAPTAIPDNPDVVDDFFELCSTVLRLHPALLAESELLLSSFQCGCAALRIQHREANRAVVGFFEMLLVLRQAGERCSEMGPRPGSPRDSSSFGPRWAPLAAMGSSPGT